MEIDIPDLGDVGFTEKCRYCMGTGKMTDYKYKPPKPKPKNWEYPECACEYCSGLGKVFNDVGKRLLVFLRECGLTIKHPLEY